MKTPNIEELIADLKMYAGDNGYGHIDYADTMRNAADALTAQAERIKELQEMVRRAVINFDEAEDERDTLRAQLAALQGDDELPDPKYIYHFDPTAADGEDDLFVFSESGPVDKDCSHCERLYTADQLRQHAAQVRAKMVPMTVLELVSAEYNEWIRFHAAGGDYDEFLRKKLGCTHCKEYRDATGERVLPSCKCSQKRAAHGITGEPK